MAFEDDTVWALMLGGYVDKPQAHQSSDQTTTTCNLKRRGALRCPPGSNIVVEEVDIACGLRRSNAVHRPRVKKTSTAAPTDCTSRTTTSSGLTVSTATNEGGSSVDGDSNTAKVPRPSRFKEHLDEEEADADSQGSTEFGSRLSEKLRELKVDVKRAIRHRPSYTGVEMYEGT